MLQRKRYVITFLLILVALPILAGDMGPGVRAATTASIGLNPSSIANLSLTSGNVAFRVNIANSPSINQFYVSLMYNYGVLQAASINLNGNVLGSGAAVFVECLDGFPVVGNTCQPWDGQGVTSIGMTIFGGQTTAPTNGLLFQMTFKIVSRGFSQMHFLRTILGNGTLVGVPLTTTDGYFTNVDCPVGSGFLCKPPVPSFTFTPATPVSGQLVTFNASASRTVNSRATIQSFTWDFGDLTAPQLNATNPANPVISHTYGGDGNYTVTLSVTDSDDVTASKTIVVNVLAPKDFSIAPPAILGLVIVGQNVNGSVVLSSINGFSGLVSLSARVNLLGPSNNPPTVAPTQTSLQLKPDGTNSTTIVVSTVSTTTTGPYGIEVDGISGVISHSAGILLRVDPPMFTVSCHTPEALSCVLPEIAPGNGVTMNIFLASIGFTGIVDLSAAVASQATNGVSLSLSPSKVSLTSGMVSTIALTFATVASTPVQDYLVIVTGTSGTLVADSSPIVIRVLVPSSSSPILTQLHWQHRLSVSGGTNSQMFVAGISNPSNSTTVYAQVEIIGVNTKGTIAFTVASRIFALSPAGSSGSIQLNVGFTGSPNDSMFKFFVNVQWGLQPNFIEFTSTLTAKGVPSFGKFIVG